MGRENPDELLKNLFHEVESHEHDTLGVQGGDVVETEASQFSSAANEQQVAAARDRNEASINNSHSRKVESKVSPHTPEQWREIALKAQQGDKAAKEALTTIVMQNLHQAACRMTNNEDVISDVVQAGYVQVTKTLTKLDLSRIQNFASFLRTITANSIKRAFSEMSGKIVLTRRETSIIKKIRQATKTLETTLGREPTTRELGDYCSLTDEQIRRHQLLSDTGSLASLDEKAENGEVHSIADGLIEDEEKERDFRLDLARFLRRLDTLFPKLSKEQQTVIRMEFFESNSLSEIASRMGLTKQKVFRIHHAALQRLEAEEMSVHPERLASWRSEIDPTPLSETKSTNERYKEVILRHVSKFNAQQSAEEVVAHICSELPFELSFFDADSDIDHASHEETIRSLMEQLLASGQLLKLKTGNVCIPKEFLRHDGTHS